MQELIKEKIKETIDEAWGHCKSLVKPDCTRKADFEGYLEELDMQDFDHVLFFAGYITALRDLEGDITRSEIRQGRETLLN